MDNLLKYRVKAIVFALTKGGIPLHIIEEFYPFFIIGSGRCGTTLLRRILSANEGIYIPPENWSLGGLINKFKTYGLYEDWNTIVDIAIVTFCNDTQGWFEKIPTDLAKKLKNCPVKKRSLSFLINSMYHYHAGLLNVNCNRWGDKTPLNVNNLQPILQVFPNAKFIHLVRDGVDVVNSYKNRDGNGILKPAIRWLSAIEAVERFSKKYPDKILEIRYENLAKKPEVEAATICNFLSIPFDKNIFNIQKSSVTEDLEKYSHYKNALKPVFDKHIGKGRRELDQIELDKLAVKINPMLNKLGYETI
jgi:hypothetical protein